MDFLGLRNLTTLDGGGPAHQPAASRRPDRPRHASRWTIAKTFELFQRGETKGVFQLESAGIRDLLIKMKPDRFADIIATNALYRPGPLNGGMVDEYVDVKNGRKQAVLPPSRPQGGPGRDLRRDGLSRTGHADLEPPGGHRALAGVRDDQGDLEEEGRRHRPEPRPVHQGSHRPGPGPGEGRPRSST